MTAGSHTRRATGVTANASAPATARPTPAARDPEPTNAAAPDTQPAEPIARHTRGCRRSSATHAVNGNSRQSAAPK
jgi:hypothetical protein